MAEIKLQGTDKVAIVDDFMLDYFLTHSTMWRISGRGYAWCNSKVTEGLVWMHLATFEKKKGFQGDHINRNKLDNRIENLRYVSKQENTLNRPKKLPRHKAKFTSKYKNVHWYPARNKWQAQHRTNGKNKHLGYFENEYDAHLAVKAHIFATYSKESAELFFA